MLSTHLAELYQAEPRTLIQAVKRHLNRFPSDFMFQLTDSEFKNLKSQIVTSSWGGLRRANPYAFTEQGVAMLSSILNSERAVQVNIAIMRAFVRLREILSSHKDIVEEIKKLKREQRFQRRDIKRIFDIIEKLLTPSKLRSAAVVKKPFGFRTN